MLPEKSLRCWLAGIVAAGALVAASTPATAAPSGDDPAPALAVYSRALTLVAGGAGKVTTASISASAAVAIPEATVTYDVRDLAGTVTISPEWGLGNCVRPQAGILACQQGNIWLQPGDSMDASPWVVLAATDGPADRTEGVLKISVSAPGFDTATTESAIKIGTGVDLVAGDRIEQQHAPGDAVSVPLMVRNASDVSAEGAAVVISSSYGFHASHRYRNCTYLGDQPQACVFDNRLEPGRGYTALLPYLLGADTYAPSDQSLGMNWMTPAEFADYVTDLAHYGGSMGEPGDSGDLTLTEVDPVRARASQADPAPDNNYSSFTADVTGENHADLAAVGATVSGRPGDTVTATIGFVNHGPATLNFGRSGSGVTRIDVAVPTGTTVTAVPTGCQSSNDGELWQWPGEPGASAYRCHATLMIPNGDRQTFDFAMRVDDPAASLLGSVTVRPKLCECESFGVDLDPSNDVAEIRVDVPGGGPLS